VVKLILNEIICGPIFAMNALSRIAPAVPLRQIAPPRLEAAARAPVRKWPIRFQMIEPIVIFTDIAAIITASLLCGWVAGIDGEVFSPWKAAGSAILVASLFVSLLKIHGLYRPMELLAWRHQLDAVVKTWAIVLFLMGAAFTALEVVHDISRAAGLFAVVGLPMLIALRFATRRVLWVGLRGRKFAGRNVVLVTDRPPTSSGAGQALEAFGTSIAQTFVLPPAGAGLSQRKRLSARVIEFVSGSDVEEIIVEADPNRWSELRSFVGDLKVLPAPIAFAPLGAAAELFRRPTRELGNSLYVDLHRAPLTTTQCAAKRTLDVLGAGAALLLLSPVLALAAIAVKLDSPGPVLFKQQRCGFNGRAFTIWKFRSMSVLEDGPSVVQARRLDKRVTRVGRWLRRTSVDELPQLLNVIQGSMSLVGPRPHALAHENQFDKSVRNYAFRRRVKPGLTGWAQVHGCRGETPTNEAIERRVEYDLWYIDNWDLRLDLAILLRTPVEVLRARNAF
jgi:putative colanic acid biosynthesis UDP-glucose lipid carrier transferase